MNGRREFRPAQAEDIARAFKEEGVDYLRSAPEIAAGGRHRR